MAATATLTLTLESPKAELVEEVLRRELLPSRNQASRKSKEQLLVLLSGSGSVEVESGGEAQEAITPPAYGSVLQALADKYSQCFAAANSIREKAAASGVLLDTYQVLMLVLEVLKNCRVLGNVTAMKNAITLPHCYNARRLRIVMNKALNQQLPDIKPRERLRVFDAMLETGSEAVAHEDADSTMVSLSQELADADQHHELNFALDETRAQAGVRSKQA